MPTAFRLVCIRSSRKGHGCELMLARYSSGQRKPDASRERKPHDLHHPHRYAMRRAARTDANQAELVELARKLGLRVYCRNDDLADLDVQFGGVHEIWEIKRPGDARRLLTKRQVALREQGWCIRLIQTAEDVLRAVKTIRADHAAINRARL